MIWSLSGRTSLDWSPSRAAAGRLDEFTHASGATVVNQPGARAWRTSVARQACVSPGGHIGWCITRGEVHHHGNQ